MTVSTTGRWEVCWDVDGVVADCDVVMETEVETSDWEDAYDDSTTKASASERSLSVF